MARLYWRVKLNGKWTFRPVKFTQEQPEQMVIAELLQYNQVVKPEEDE